MRIPVFLLLVELIGSAVTLSGQDSAPAPERQPVFASFRPSRESLSRIDIDRIADGLKLYLEDLRCIPPHSGDKLALFYAVLNGVNSRARDYVTFQFFRTDGRGVACDYWGSAYRIRLRGSAIIISSDHMRYSRVVQVPEGSRRWRTQPKYGENSIECW